MPETQTTTLSRQWLFKTGAFTVVLLGFGVWALADAMLFYPRRGEMDASFKLKNWLEAADANGQLNVPTFTLANPGEALDTLERREPEIRAAASGEGSAARSAALDAAKLDYLRSLSRLWRLNTRPKFLGDSGPGRLLYFEPALGTGYAISNGNKTSLSLNDLRRDLVAKWNTSRQPTPLSGYDLPVQWIFTVLGFGGGIWLLWTFAKAKATSRKITWEADSQRLCLPSGACMTPGDLSEIDKRLWHKYYATLVTKDGSRHKLDLLRYTPLEEWVLSMEKTAFPELAAAEAAEKAEKAQTPVAEPSNAEA